MCWWSNKHCLSNCVILIRTCCCAFVLAVGDGGVDEVELMLDPDVSLDRQMVVDKARIVLQAGGLTNKKLVSIVPRNSPLANDYDPMVIVGSHPSMFPYNKGGPPEGMSMTCWAANILQRYPVEQFAQNTGAIPDMFNRLQRHQVNAQAHVQFNLQPDRLASIATLDEAQVNVVLEAHASCAFGARLQQIMAPLPPAAWDLLGAVRAMGGRIMATPQSFASLRSKVLAPQGIFGPYTCSLNLCPSEIGSKWTFCMAGYEVDYDDAGHLTGRPHTSQCYRIVAANPVAAAEFLHCYMRAFCAVFLGWPMECEQQKHPECLFGRICVAYLKYESSTRGGKHAHGQVLQPAMQAARLKDLMSNGTTMEYQLYSFMDGIMAAYFPIPTAPPTCNDTATASLWKEHAPMVNGETFIYYACWLLLLCQNLLATSSSN